MESTFSFEQFPYRKLDLPVSRRNFLTALLKEANGTIRAINQKPIFRLCDLGELEINKLSRIVPALHAGIRFEQNPDFVIAKAPQKTEFIRLCERGSAAHTLIQYFNLELTIQEISIKISEQHLLPKSFSMEYTRGFFLFLVESGFAYPEAGTPNES